MFQRLKGFNLDNFLDSKIAEEQAKQGKSGQSANSAKRSPSNAHRGSGRTDSPSRKNGAKLTVPNDEGRDVAQAADPEDFVIGDDLSDVSRAATPRPVKEDDVTAAADGAMAGEKKDETSSKGKAPARSSEELPGDVVQKLAKLDAYTSRYKELLRNYRTAHARVQQTEAFEATLREHTPLANISDPGALVEFLNQRGLQSEMVLQELKRITGEQRDVVKERDELKVKLEEAEKRATTAFDEVAGLRKEREEQASIKAAAAQGNQAAIKAEATTAPAEAGAKDGDDSTFFSHDNELESQVKALEEEIKQQRAYIIELETENATTHQDYDMTRLDLEAMKNKITVRDREIAGVMEQLAAAKSQNIELEKSRDVTQDEQEHAVSQLVTAEAQCVGMQEKLKAYQENLRQTHKELEEKAAASEENAATAKRNAVAAEENLQKYQAEHEKNLRSGRLGGEAQEKRMKTYQEVIEKLRAQIKQTEDARKTLESETANLKLELRRLESEANSRSTLIERERAEARSAKQARLWAESQMHAAIAARDEALRLAEAKRGHEAAVAGLKGQLKRAEKDRDLAYQLILDCGKCKTEPSENDALPETPTEMSSTPRSRSRGGSDTTELTESTQPTEAGTPSVEIGEPVSAEAKKSKKKKKSKAKKKGASEDSSAVPASIGDLIADPKKASAMLDGGDVNESLLKAHMDAIRRMEEQRNEEDDDSTEALRLHHEAMIETRDQIIKDNKLIIRDRDEMIESLQVKLNTEQDEITRLTEEMTAHEAVTTSPEEVENLRNSIMAKDEAIDMLNAKLRGEEDLREEIEMLRDSLTEAGSESTDAKHELKQTKETRAKLQQDLIELQSESDGLQKQMKDAEAQRDNLSRRCSSLEIEIAGLKATHVSTGLMSDAQLARLTEAVEKAQKETVSLKAAKEAAETELEELRQQHSTSGADLKEKHKILTIEFEELKTRAATLDTDLTAANQLAQTRFKDLTDLREHATKIQAEFTKLRAESAELKTLKTELEKSNSTIKRLESKERDLRSEIAVYKTNSAEKDSEITKLRDQAKKSEERCTALEDTYERARKDLEANEQSRDEAVEGREKLTQQLEKALKETKIAKAAREELENKIAKLGSEASGLREELQIKSAQQQSAQSLMDSLQDQSRELATQMKEVRERCESLDEELADAHRLLAERSREGDTMRRLLAEVETRAENRVRETRERMDLAVEERDRAEEEASTVGRRKAREIEELKNKVREAETAAMRASAAAQDAERRERDFKAKQTELEQRASQAQDEVTEVRAAMSQLRDALDASERQVSTLSASTSDLRSSLQDREQRLEKLQKASKTMAEEMRSLQTSKLRQNSTAVTSSRSSTDSRVMSPGPRNGTPTSALSGGVKEEGPDLVYLKNVMLQFLETREKKLQMQLVPVLGMLLHFDKQDQQKWNAAISAR